MKNRKVTTWMMLTVLWKLLPKDCRKHLVYEFLLAPNALKHRYHEEVKFQRTVRYNW